ncbi:MAG: hypothetical protein IT360_01505 [Gemmatimonadaceae bacterium]|nr:hypothetical protein [Gemmatimonadaceae bacterium]
MTQLLAWRSWCAATVLVAGMACAGGGGRSGAGGIRSDVIYRNEIGKTSAVNAYDAVRRLRPAFLTGRGPSTLLRASQSTSAPVVYLDNQRFGAAESLRDIPVDGIVEIRFLTAAQAQVRWGMNHPAGVILVITGSARGTSP